MIVRTVIGLLAVTVILNSSADEFKMSSLIVPQGVSYRVTPIRFTRDVKIVEGKLDTKSIKSTDSSGGNKSSSEDHSSSDNTTTTDTSVEKNAGASAKAGASLWTGFHASAEAHGGMELTSNDKNHSSHSSATKSDMSSNRESSFRDADAVEDSMQGKYGDWYLTFSIILKNLDLSDTCFIRPPAGGQLSAVVVGLTQPVIVPCQSQQSMAIGIDDVVCKFTMPVHDQQLLKELKALAEAGGMERLSAQIDGANFPIISQATGKNVLQEIKLAEMKNPTTEFVLEVGDAKVLSPWKVRQRFGRASGKRGKNVTIREALEAINEKVAEDDTMPEHVFEFDTNGTLVAVSEIRLGVADGTNEVVLCVRFDGNTAGASLHPLDAKILDSPIKNYKKLEFIDLNIGEVVKLYRKDSQKGDHLYHEFINWLRTGQQDDRKARLALGEFLLLSTNGDERRDGFNVLKAYWDKHKDLSAIKIMINGYFLLSPKEFPYRERLAEWILQLSKSEQWVQSALEKDVLDRLIADGQTDAVVELSKLPSFACSSNGVTAVMRIAKSGNVEMVKAVLKECKFDVNAGNGKVGTALEWAARNDKVEMVEYLIGLGANPALSFGNSENYRNAIDVAAGRNAVNVLKYLMEKNHYDAHKAHFCAAEQGASGAFRYLMEKYPIDPNSKWNEIPFLSYAAWGGNLSICKYLIEKGTRFDEIDGVKKYDLPISAACRNKRYEVIEYLIDKGAKIPYSARQELLKTSASWIMEKVLEKKVDAGAVLECAIGLNDTKAVEYYARRVDINAGVGPYEWLPLCWASVCNSVDAARVLVKMGAKVNHSLPKGFTPIQQACRAGSLDMVKYLYVECDAILDDALFEALKKKQKAVLDWFLAYEKDGKRMFPVDTYSHGRKGTLLMAATEMDDPEMCEYLLKKGANVKYSPKGKCSVLEYVIRIDNLPILRYLVDQRGCEVGDEIFETVRYDSMRCLKYLIEEKRMGIKYSPNRKCSFLEYVMRRDNLSVLRYLIDQRGYEVGDEILEAARNGSIRCLKYLIEEKGMNANYVSKMKSGGFLLGEAAGSGQLNICKYLIEERKVSFDYRPVREKGLIGDDLYPSAYEMAQRGQHQELVIYFNELLAERLKIRKY